MGQASHRRSEGLVAVLLLFAIVGILAAALIYKSLGTASKRLDTAQTGAASFQKIHDALVRYVMLNQRLPCPASGTAHTGDADPNGAAVTCNNSANGVVPWNTLGLDKADALDPWGRYVFYRVYDGATGFTQANGLKLSDCLDENVGTIYSLSGAGNTCNSNTHENTISDFFNGKGLWVSDMGTDRPQVAYVLLSAGASGLGAFYPGATAAMAAPNASAESLNAGSGGTKCGIDQTHECTLISASAPDVAASDASHFDDLLGYTFAVDLAKKAQLAGRPWKLYQVFSQSTVSLSGSNYNTGTSSMKVRPSSAGVNQGPVTVTAAGSLGTHYICVSNGLVQGATSCFTFSNTGNDMLDNTLGNESLEFDFRVSRTMLVIALTEFRYTGGGSNKEQAQVTFYNGVTQVDQKTVQACSSGANSVAQFTLNPASSFTKFTITPLNITSSASSSSFGVAAVLACKLTADCPAGTAPAGIGWPAIDCFG